MVPGGARAQGSNTWLQHVAPSLLPRINSADIVTCARPGSVSASTVRHSRGVNAGGEHSRGVNAGGEHSGSRQQRQEGAGRLKKGAGKKERKTSIGT